MTDLKLSPIQLVQFNQITILTALHHLIIRLTDADQSNLDLLTSIQEVMLITKNSLEKSA